MDDVFLPVAIRRLLEKGVRIPHPWSVEVGEEVSPDRVSARGVVLHGGVRLRGEQTLLCDGVKLGAEGPAVVENCLMGPDVELKGGFFRGSVFLHGVTFGSASHVREGCLLEEESSGAHAVGLKQTILFPFVTLGSLINFCDCLMGGGTSRRNHSEVGSSFIHFNYTPRQDKATASLLGDVPRGVMLDQPPIFLGGQGGIVGPVRMGFGTVLPAGAICRRDIPEGNATAVSIGGAGNDRSFHPDRRGDVGRKIRNNLLYVASLFALQDWYAHVRSRFFAAGTHERELLPGALAVLDGAVSERIRRLREFSGKMPAEDEAVGETEAGNARRRQLRERWPEAESMLGDRAGSFGDQALRDRFLAVLDRRMSRPSGPADYLPFIRVLDPSERQLGTAWLESVVSDRMERVLGVLAAFRSGSAETA
ncbi:MAG: UDP-N-acetylglucosamine pyrophosphorylase [Syntrophaceae bacterium]|nr:UDP-N-acetylglucosamine pyrophosphorylase [Syntrophaceae bacterium]